MIRKEKNVVLKIVFIPSLKGFTFCLVNDILKKITLVEELINQFAWRLRYVSSPTDEVNFPNKMTAQLK